MLAMININDRYKEQGKVAGIRSKCEIHKHDKKRTKKPDDFWMNACVDVCN